MAYGTKKSSGNMIFFNVYQKEREKVVDGEPVKIPAGFYENKTGQTSDHISGKVTYVGQRDDVVPSTGKVIEKLVVGMEDQGERYQIEVPRDSSAGREILGLVTASFLRNPEATLELATRFNAAGSTWKNKEGEVVVREKDNLKVFGAHVSETQGEKNTNLKPEYVDLAGNVVTSLPGVEEIEVKNKAGVVVETKKDYSESNAIVVNTIEQLAAAVKAYRNTQKQGHADDGAGEEAVSAEQAMTAAQRQRG